MKTLMTLLALNLMIQTVSNAADFRYTYPRARCFVILPNETMLTLFNLGSVDTGSNYNCANALENVESECERIAKSMGHSTGSIYRDIVVTQKSGNRSETSEVTTAHSNTRVGPFAVFGRKRQDYQSVKGGKSEASSSDVQYIYLDEKLDCKVKSYYPQSGVPTKITDSNFGG